MLLDLRPLTHNRDFRRLFLGQLVSYLGSMISYVAVPYQVYELTRSSAIVGMMGAVQLVPLLIFGLLGGSVADTMDRRRLLLLSEGVMGLTALGLAANAWLPQPSVPVIFVLVALMQAANGFHRPALDALTQRIVDRADFAAISALNAFRSSAGAILGPALGGILIATAGAGIAFLADAATFIFAMIMVAGMSRVPAPSKGEASHLGAIAEGLRYAVRRPELMGTYIVDVVAMAFAFPTALFPEMAQGWGGPKAAGWLFSAMSVGALVTTVASGWTGKVSRHGAAVVISAGIWGAAIFALGYANSLEMAIVCLAIAGAADMVSGLFRGIIWNETIPNEMRGRLAGIEMISYMAGPLLGNARAGWVAALVSTRVSIISGGALCVAGVAICAFALPAFWAYRKRLDQ
ncbi:MAG TPA: MFS transporter [Bdellovibrionota bacterium]|nr:MFS transporter [Bdellovibrionota bacterium]